MVPYLLLTYSSNDIMLVVCYIAWHKHVAKWTSTTLLDYL